MIAFSGGRTSALMLQLLLDGSASRDAYTVLFCNTGKEKDETLDFVHNVETCWGIPVIWLEYTRVPATPEIAAIYPHKKSRDTVMAQYHDGLTTHWFKVCDYATARRRDHENTPFDELLSWANVLPNVRNRMCSVQMKVRTMMRYIFSRGIYRWTDNIGIRADEAHRAMEINANCPKYRRPNFPLIEAGITEPDVLAFWAAQDFDLQLESYQGNCDLCFLKARWKRVKIIREEPKSVKWWLEQESKFAVKPHITGDGKFFRKGQPYRDIELDAGYIDPQNSLFDSEDIDVPCGCADKGFVVSEDMNCEI